MILVLSSIKHILPMFKTEQYNNFTHTIDNSLRLDSNNKAQLKLRVIKKWFKFHNNIRSHQSLSLYITPKQAVQSFTS